MKKTLQNQTNVNISYWEKNIFLSHYDLIVIGSGIVGLFSALSYKQKNKKAKVLVVERGVLPYGASTKNAGFACFGSPSELMDDLSKMPEEIVWETVSMRWKGLQLLRKTLGDKHMDFKAHGGYEVFAHKSEYDKCVPFLPYLNSMAFEATGLKNCYRTAAKEMKQFGFNYTEGLLLNRGEGQIDTGMMMQSLLKLTTDSGVTILNGITVTGINDSGKKVAVLTNWQALEATKVIVATNGFAKELLKIKDVEPARAQVLITKPIHNLKLKGTFHYQQGYYYFRNIHNRVLFGGGRNLDLKAENTTEFKLTSLVQNELERLLREMILPGQTFEVDHRWAGIMGVGKEKKPIINHITNNVVAAVRMGGMGVAIGSLVGKQAAEMCYE
jgi:gamma-glutamylputrescine oxidase